MKIKKDKRNYLDLVKAIMLTKDINEIVIDMHTQRETQKYEIVEENVLASMDKVYRLVCKENIYD